MVISHETKFSMKKESVFSIIAATASLSTPPTTTITFITGAVNPWKYTYQDIQLFTKRIENNSKDVEAYFLRGRTYLEYEDEENAISDITNVIDLNPDDYFLYYTRGIARKRRDKTGAIGDFTKAIELNSNEYLSYFHRATILTEIGDKIGAIADFTKAIELNSYDITSLDYRGRLRNELGDKLGAIDDYSRCIEIVPYDSYSFSQRGIIRADLGDIEGAIDDLSKNIVLFPESFSYALRGKIRARFKDILGALDDYNKAIKMSPSYVEAYGSRGELLSILGDKEGSIADFLKAKELSEDIGI